MIANICQCNLNPPDSTIFDNEYNEDETMIRCGFKYCKCDHKYFPPTEEAVSSLSTHVSLSVDSFVMREAMSDSTLLFSTQPRAAPFLGIFPARWPKEDQLRPSSIICILELDDDKCTLLEWLPGLIRSMYAGSPAYPYIFTRRFHSRKHLLQDLLLGELHKNLSSVHTPDYRKLPILLVLSTHGPSQGQVFSTTPSRYTDKFDGYCEYCSLYDFVVTAQMALGDTLCGIYVSSCYTGKLDKSHKEYPVDIGWLKDGTLKTDLVAPAAEVYYSGSQTADAYMISAFVESAGSKNKEEFIKSKPLKAIVNNIKENMFPDLYNEMKLCYLNDADISSILGNDFNGEVKTKEGNKDENKEDKEGETMDGNEGEEDDEKKDRKKRKEGKTGDITKNNDNDNNDNGYDDDDDDDTVHEHKVIVSDLVVAFLPISPKNNTIALALSRNLSIRSDIRVDTLVLNSDTAESQLQGYTETKRLLLVVVDVVPEKSFVTIVKCMECISLAKKLLSKSRYPYGVIFMCGLEETMKRYKSFKSYPSAMMVTKSVRPSTWVPLIMYSVHLPAGENGQVQTGLATTPLAPSDVSETWELEDVVKECKYVCKGMAEETSFQLLSSGNVPHYPLRLKHHPTTPDKGSDSGSLGTLASSSSSSGSSLSQGSHEGSDATTGLSIPKLTIPTSVVTETKKHDGEEEPIDGNDGDMDPALLAPPVQKRAKVVDTQKRGRGRRKSSSCKYSDEDLPLSANFRDVPVTNMNIKWEIDFTRHVMYGEIEYWTKDLTKDGAKELVLDYSMLNIWEVFVVQPGVKVEEEEAEAAAEGEVNSRGERLVPVEFTTTPYSVTIRRPQECERFPERVVIRFSTTPEGLSVMWRPDADNNPCVFTGSCPLNNRSIMPCQDAPEAIVTYTAAVTVPDKYRVIMSAPAYEDSTQSQPGKDTSEQQQKQEEEDKDQKGKDDANANTNSNANNQRPKYKTTYFFRMNTPLPPSTISIAAGKFEEHAVQGLSVPASIYAPATLLLNAVNSFVVPLKELLPALIEYLGPFPFERADIVVMPADFLPLGLQNPNVTFLSQSMITVDGSMSMHLAHELAHNYFGLLISESDWYEMWLSEGFADYVSERVFLKCVGLTPREQEEHSRIASLLKYQSLLDDIRNTDDSEHTLTSSGSEDGVVKGCMRPVLGTIQYNMGYFILRHLALNVGVEQFDKFLAKYVSHFRNKLLTGKDALDFFFSEFSDKVAPGFSTADMEVWLDSSNIKNNLDWKIRSLCSCSKDTNMFLAAIERDLVLFYKASGLIMIGRRDLAEELCKEIAMDMHISWDTTMKQLFLAMAGETKEVRPEAYLTLDRYAMLTESNADIRNLFCEIIVKLRITDLYSHVERLLVKDQPMGLYVFSELLSAGKVERKLALSIYEKLCGRQDPQKHTTMLKLLRDYKVMK